MYYFCTISRVTLYCKRTKRKKSSRQNLKHVIILRFWILLFSDTKWKILCHLVQILGYVNITNFLMLYSIAIFGKFILLVKIKDIINKKIRNSLKFKNTHDTLIRQFSTSIVENKVQMLIFPNYSRTKNKAIMF